jgi:VanZ family protein
MTGIWLLSSIPDQGNPETTAEQLLQWVSPELQNYLHIPLFGGLAAAWYWALQPLPVSRRQVLSAVLLIPSLYSFIDEWHQLQVPGRFGSLTDIVLNLVGILAVVLYVTWMPRQVRA